MSIKKNIKLLVLPELFPDVEGDWKGVFIEDYLKSVENIPSQTLYVRLKGAKKGITDELFNNQFKVRRVSLSSKKISPFLKPFFYIMWYLKGIKHGKSFTDTTIIHAHGLVLNGLLAYFISKKLKVPFVVTEHTGPFSRIAQHLIFSKIAKFVSKRAAKVLVVSEHQKKEVLKLGIAAKNVEVTYNPINTDLFKKAEHSARSKNIAFVSRLDEFKGGLRTLKAFHILIEKYQDYKLTIVGDGEEYKAIETYIIQNKLEKKVELKGTLTKPQIAKILYESSFLVFPSRHETFGLVVAEALSCGIPVVCTNQTAPKEFINKSNGVLVNPDDVDAIYQGMLQIIKHYASYNVVKISEEVTNRFGLVNFGKKLIAIYNQT